MKKAILFLILMLNVQGFIVSCGCPDENYYDYRGIRVQALDSIVFEDEILYLDVGINQTYYLSTNSRWSSFSYESYATTVCEKGRDGLKYAVTNVSIFSDSDFNAEYPAGTNLNGIFKAYGYYEDNLNENVFDYINLLYQNNLVGNFFFLEMRPEIDMTHRFEVRVEKINGEVVTGFSDEITWE